MTELVLTPVVGGLILLTLMLVIGIVVTGQLVDGAAIGEFDGSATIRGWLLRLPSLLGWFLLMLVLMRGALQLLAFSDPGVPPDSELVRAVLTSGAWGNSWLIQLAAAFAMLALAWLFAARPIPQRIALALTVSVAVLAEAGMGHGVEALWQPLVLGRLVHAIHILAAGIWIGTLMILALTVTPTLIARDSRGPLANVIARFSYPARAGVLLLVATGVIQIWQYAGSLIDLPSLLWGKLLLLKLLLLLPVLGVGWYNWRIVTPRLARGEPPAMHSLRRAMLIEVTLAALIIAVTAVLIRQALPVDMATG